MSSWGTFASLDSEACYGMWFLLTKVLGAFAFAGYLWLCLVTPAGFARHDDGTTLTYASGWWTPAYYFLPPVLVIAFGFRLNALRKRPGADESELEAQALMAWIVGGAALLFGLLYFLALRGYDEFSVNDKYFTERSSGRRLQRDHHSSLDYASCCLIEVFATEGEGRFAKLWPWRLRCTRPDEMIEGISVEARFPDLYDRLLVNACRAGVPIVLNCDSPAWLDADVAEQARRFTLAATTQVPEELVDAIDFFTHAIEQKPSATVFCYRARAYLKTGALDQAIADCNEALDRKPTLGIGYYYRGIAKHASGDKPAAEQDWLEAKRLGFTRPANL